MREQLRPWTDLCHGRAGYHAQVVCAASAIGRVGIFHLVRAANDPSVFRSFAASLLAAPPSSEWTLELIFKGFPSEAATAPFRAQVTAVPTHCCFIDDSGYDISSYLAAARRTSHDTAVFFNSFSEIIEPRWFEILRDAFIRPGVGVVGATGSLESVVRNHRIYGGAKNLALAAGLLALFPPFPNPHIRTNAFMIARESFLALRAPAIKTRLGALVYESGWTSMTRQLQACGLAPMIVDRAGRAFSSEAWADARTFRSGSQENVIVRDNRIKEYEVASLERRALLRRLAFGDQVRS